MSQQPEVKHPPLQLDQEWANAMTHGVGAALTLVAGWNLVLLAGERTTGMTVACIIYITATLGTYLCSTLSHVVRRQPLLNRMRAWDQAMIYVMIAGTYTPVVVKYAAEPTRSLLLATMWAAAGTGFLSKVAMKHRVNSAGTVSYLLLGYLPAVVLAGHVPTAIAGWMLAGGIIYSIGVVFLINDKKMRYLHAGWHLMVMAASGCHFIGMIEVVTGV
jgi:hemolysin III